MHLRADQTYSIWVTVTMRMKGGLPQNIFTLGLQIAGTNSAELRFKSLLGCKILEFSPSPKPWKEERSHDGQCVVDKH